MNKRPHPSGLGLPAKPYIPPANPGPAPPLPPGPPPGQQVPHQQQNPGGYGGGQDAAHAAAWAAYYQSQGAPAGTAYTTASTSKPPSQQSQSAAANPYANYGYGAGASIPGVNAGYSAPYQPQSVPPQPVAGPSQPYGYSAPAQTPAYGGPQQPAQVGYGGQPQPGGYNPPNAGYQPQPAYSQPPPQQQGVGRPPYHPPPQHPSQGQQHNPQGYGWANQAPAGPTPPAYRPPQPPIQQGGYSPAPNHPQQQPYFPQQQNRPPAQQQSYQPQHPYRPPAPPPNRPYQPSASSGQPQHQNRAPSGPAPQRLPPPQHGPGGQGSNFPPAKRPRFDSPGGGSGPMNGHQGGASPIRPVVGGPGRPPFGGNGNAGPGPSGASNPFGGAVKSGLGGRSSLPPPPIHLGTSSTSASSMAGPPIILPPQRIGFGAPSRGGAPLRGGSYPRGRGGGMVVGAPRGPSGMRRSDTATRGRSENGLAGKASRENERRKRDKDGRERKADGVTGLSGSSGDKEAKTTMTDFRIVGIEMKDLGWSWGLVSGVDIQVKEEVIAKETEEKVTEDKDKDPFDGNSTTDLLAKLSGTEAAVAGVAVDAQPDTVDTAESNSDQVEEKRGEKRKAKTTSPDGDDEGETASKKRSSAYILTHGKVNERSQPSDLETASNPAVEPSSIPSKPSAPSHESSQNRFRIYFESPPELDRIPKAIRRGGSGSNPNKRWRRESSSVAPSRVGDVAVSEDGADAETIEGDAEENEAAATGLEGAGESDEVEGSDGMEPGAELQEATEKEGASGTSAQEPEEPVPVAASEEIGDVSQTVADETSDVPEVCVPEGEATEDTAVPGEITALAETQDLTGNLAVENSSAADIEISVDAFAPPDDVDSAEAAGDILIRADTGATDQAIEVSGTVVGEEPLIEVVTAPAEQVESEIIQTAQEAPISPDKIETAVPVHPLTGAEASAAELAAALAVSAQNTASAYSSRPTKTRRWSESSTGSHHDTSTPANGKSASASGGQSSGPSTNRLSILYEDSSRRLCFDADVVEKVKIFREVGKIEVLLKVHAKVDEEIEVKREVQSSEGAEEVDEKEVVAGVEEPMKVSSLPPGILVETYNNVEQRFTSMTQKQLSDLYEASTTHSVPPLHRVTALSTTTSEHGLTLTVYLNKKKPLSEPKWSRNNQADEWLFEQFGKVSTSEAGWKGKLEIVDPDPPPTLQSILEGWTTSSSGGPISDRRAFTQSLLVNPNNLLEILLRLARGDRNPTSSSLPYSSSIASHSPTGSGSFGALASAIRHDSPYASHQTHVSLAILAMYKLTTDYAEKAGEKVGVVEEKIADIIKSLPVGMICRSLDGLFKEWITGKGRN